MKDSEQGIVREVVWFEVLPWLNLFRCFRLALETRLLFLAAVGLVLMLSGWAVLGLAFSGAPEVAAEFSAVPSGPIEAASPDLSYSCPWLATSSLVPNEPGWPPGRPFGRITGVLLSAHHGSFLGRGWDPLTGTWEHLSRPFRQFFTPDLTLAMAAFLLLAGLWALAVWAYFGGAISRVVAVEFATGERISWSSMFAHAAAKWPAYFFAPLGPLLVVVGLALVICVGGWLLRAEVGILLMGVAWGLVLLAGLAMAALLLGLIFGWPLMWGTIAAEGSDSWDALSRSYGYTLQRPFHYFFYVLLTIGIGLLAWLVVSNFAAGVIYLCSSAAAWGAGTHNMADIFQGSDDLGVAGTAGAWLIRFWTEGVKVFAAAFLYSYFWSAATGMYFLLRRDVDAVELDEVYLEEDEQDPSYGLPPLKTDAAGAPVVGEEGDGK